MPPRSNGWTLQDIVCVCALCAYLPNANQYILKEHRSQPRRIVGVRAPHKNRLIPRRPYAVCEDCVLMCLCVCVCEHVCVLVEYVCVRWQSSVPSGETDTNSHHCRRIPWDSKLSLAVSMPASPSLTICLDTHTHTRYINLSRSLPPSLLLSLSPEQNLATVFPHHTHSFPITRQVAAVPRQ